jgi:hypothetical protein
MTPAAGWPRRFEVRIGRAPDVATYRVVTWAGAGKAESLARAAHRRRHPEGDGPSGTEVVDVVEVDPPARTARGTVALDPDDVIDRLEF